MPAARRTGPWLTFFGRQKPGTCSPLLSFPMRRISLCSSSISASWLPASSFCGKPGKSREDVRALSTALPRQLQNNTAGRGAWVGV